MVQLQKYWIDFDVLRCGNNNNSCEVNSIVLAQHKPYFAWFSRRTLLLFTKTPHRKQNW